MPKKQNIWKAKLIFTLLISIIYLLLINSGNIHAQVIQEWVSRYNGPGNGWDEITTMAVDAAGNIYVAGWSIGSGTGSDFVTIKYDSSGVQQWVQRYNGPGNATDIAWAMVIDDSANVYVTGESSTSGTTNIDYATIKYNSAGILQWVQRYAGPASAGDWAYSIAVDRLHNVYVTGGSIAPATYSDYLTIKYNSAGVQKWVQRYNNISTNGNDIARSIAVDTLGYIYVTGNSDGWYADYLTIKYDTAGAIQWIRRYDGASGIGADNARSVALDNSGNIYVGGYSWGSGSNFDYAVIKYNSSGDSLWVRRYNGPSNSDDRSYQIASLNSGDVFMTGGSLSSPSGFDFATVKYDSSGTQKWVQRYNGPLGSGNDDAYSITVDSSGNVYVTGRSMGTGSNYDIATVKYNSSGVQQWVQRYNGPGNGTDWANSILVDDSGNVYVSGLSAGSGTSNDCVTIKYSQVLTGITLISSEIPNDFSLSQNYPNPFNPSTNIRYYLPKKSFVSMKIYDILGREVATLVNERLNAGLYEYIFDGAGLTSGIYFYRIKAGEFIETKKMLMVK